MNNYTVTQYTDETGDELLSKFNIPPYTL